MTTSKVNALVLLAGLGVGALLAPGQSASASRIEFEAASVRPAAVVESTGGARSGGSGAPFCGGEKLTIDGSQVRFKCVTPKGLIAYAFGVPADRIAGPAWMMDARTSLIDPGTSPQFDIAAKLPQGASSAQVPAMFQSLLEDRFRLAIHRASREGAVTALVVAPGELTLREASPNPIAPVVPAGVPLCTGGDSCLPRVINAGTEQIAITPVARGITQVTSPSMGTALSTTGQGKSDIEAPNTTLAGLAYLLGAINATPVVDMTGLKGRYQVVLKISYDMNGPMNAVHPDTAVNDVLRDMNTAIAGNRDKALKAELQKLGLRVESRKGPIETIIVDRLEKTPTAN